MCKPHIVLGTRDEMVRKNRQGPYQMAAWHVVEKPGVHSIITPTTKILKLWIRATKICVRDT